MTTCKANQQLAWDFSLQTIDAKPFPLRSLEGKVLLLVNTASECGFTKQYAELEEIWQTFGQRGLVVIGIPSDDFGHQEPGDNSAIKGFCSARFAITYPMMAKSHVRGDQALPIYKWAAKQTFFSPALELSQIPNRSKWTPCCELCLLDPPKEPARFARYRAGAGAPSDKAQWDKGSLSAFDQARKPLVVVKGVDTGVQTKQTESPRQGRAQLHQQS